LGEPRIFEPRLPARRRCNPPEEADAMPNAATNLIELDTAIAAIRENIRELVEQGAASSGAGDDDRLADRIATYETQLAAAIKRREALAK
jgi:hypothetical protein